jgi:peptide/nickel transport system permease protein
LPLAHPFDPDEQFVEGLSLEGAPLSPNSTYWLGTDLLGRDLFSRLIYGARTSLLIGVVANGTAVLIGVLVGLSAGYLQGRIGGLLMRFTDLMMAFPALLLAIALAAIFQPSVWIVSLVIAMVNWVQIARVIYAETSALSARDFIAVERTLGAGTLRILGVHLIPHLAPTVLVWATLGISTTVLLEATLSFLGVGYSRQRRVGATSSLKARAILLRLPGWCSFPARRLCCCRSLSISLVTPCATPSIPA